MPDLYHEPPEEVYKRLLAQHDWFYNESDDPTVFRKGRDERVTISRLCLLCDSDYSIWNQYAPVELKINLKGL